MIFLRAALLCFCFLAPLPAHGANLNLSTTPQHYAREMEFYYLKPRLEMLGPMLATFQRGRVLANAEKRMFVAAFLAALSGKGQIDLMSFANAPDKLDRDTLLTLAWAAHLSGNPHENDFLQKLLANNEKVAVAQIKNSPAHLTAWDPAWEKSALNMHWAAFMATGENIWLDKIIKTSLGYAHNLKGGSEAAASLYDYAPRHPFICSRLQFARKRASQREREIIDTILVHAKTDQKK